MWVFGPSTEKQQLTSLDPPHFRHLFSLNLQETTRLNHKMKNILASWQVSYLLLNLKGKYLTQFWGVLTGFVFALYDSAGQVSLKRNHSTIRHGTWHPRGVHLRQWFSIPWKCSSWSMLTHTLDRHSLKQPSKVDFFEVYSFIFRTPSKICILL